MHRITVVTRSVSPERRCGRSSAASPDVTIQNWTPSSSAPPLEASSDESARDQRSPPTSVSQPRKKSNWRTKRIQNDLTVETEALDLDLSALERRDLPIKLVVDDPMPVGKYYGDPYADEKKHKRKAKKENVKITREIAASPVCVGDEKVGSGAGSCVFTFEDHPTENTESWLVPFTREPETTAEVETKDRKEKDHHKTIAKQSQSVECHLDGGSVSVDDRSCHQDIIRCNGPVVRIEYQGEMVSVSEQTAARLQEGACDWV